MALKLSPIEGPVLKGPATDNKAKGLALPLATSYTVLAVSTKAAGACQGPGTNLATLATGLITLSFNFFQVLDSQPNSCNPVSGLIDAMPPS